MGLAAPAVSAADAAFERLQSRLPPGLDDKVLASWNGLAIRAFAQAGFILDDAGYTDRARRAADNLAAKARKNRDNAAEIGSQIEELYRE